MGTNINITKTTQGKWQQIAHNTQVVSTTDAFGNVRYSPGSSSTVTSGASPAAVIDTVVKSGTTTPGFHTLVKKRSPLPCNNFFHSSVRHVRRTGYYKELNYRYGGILVGQILNTGVHPSDDYRTYISSVPRPPQSDYDSLDREVRTKIRLAIKQQSVNIAQIIAERDKTASSLAKIIQTVAGTILALKKGDLSQVGKHLGKHVGWKRRNSYNRAYKADPAGAAANAWLEWNYAIKPLLMDAEGLAIALAKYQYQPVIGRVVAQKVKTDKKVTKSGSLSGPDGIYRDTTETKISSKYVVIYRVDSPNMPDFSGLGLTNPLQLAWELVPFSFVVDWLLPIGNYVSSFDATVGMTFLDGSMSVKTDATRSKAHYRNARSINSSGNGEVFDEFWESSMTINEVNRTKLSSFPSVALPTFKNPASISHLFTSMALLVKAAR